MAVPQTRPEARTEALPGEPILWVLIASELAVFVAGVSVMVGLGLRDPVGFATAQAQLEGRLAALNTLVLVTSGLCAALAEAQAARAQPLWIWGAGHVGRALVAVLSPLVSMATPPAGSRSAAVFPPREPSGSSLKAPILKNSLPSPVRPLWRWR